MWQKTNLKVPIQDHYGFIELLLPASHSESCSIKQKRVPRSLLYATRAGSVDAHEGSPVLVQLRLTRHTKYKDFITLTMMLYEPDEPRCVKQEQNKAFEGNNALPKTV